MAKKASLSDTIIDAALALAETEDWRRVTLGDIAAAAKIPLADLRAHFRSKGAILAAYGRRLDDAVIAATPADLASQPARERLFDVLMRRYDAMQPHKGALRNVLADMRGDVLGWLCAGAGLMASMAAMLEAAGIGSDGPAGRMRTRGLACVYLSTLPVWFRDDSDDQARTMAQLDRRLSAAERLVGLLCAAPRRRRTAAA